MGVNVDLSKLKTSWTKFDIVQALDVVYSVETIEKYKNKEAQIDEPILRSFLGVKSLKDPIPDYWIEIQKYPNEKSIFALLALIFTHHEVVRDFALKYSQKEMKGVFIIDAVDKKQTNIRSALINAKAAELIYRRQERVPYDFSVVFYNPAVGKLFKKVLIERLTRCSVDELSNDDFYTICYANYFNKALSLTSSEFKRWLEGEPFEAHYIKEIRINKFFSITQKLELDFNDSKEIYFLGENGDGKSLLLMALYLAFNGNYILERTAKDDTGKVIDILEKNIELEGTDDFELLHTAKNAVFLENLYAYGTHRGRYSSDKFEKYGFMSLFDNDQTMINPIQWLKDLKLNEDNALESGNSSSIVIATDLLKEILCDLLERNVKIEMSGSNVSFIEKDVTLSLDELSEGYRSVIIFICDLLYRLSDKNINTDKDILKMKGVVLVDEIDLHLHPKWQRVVIKKLRTIFPNIQFFFTTHSPTIIQGASEDAILYKVYRENGITKVSTPYYRKDLDHLMMNTLVTSSLFGLEDSRMNSKDDDSNTDNTYLLYRINEKVESNLKDLKENGKTFISDAEIDEIIDEILKENLGNDKDK